MPEHDGFLVLQSHERAIQGRLTKALAFNQFAAQVRQAGVPADSQPALELGLNTVDLIAELAAALVATLVDSIHGGAEEETNGFVDVLFGGDGRQG